MSCKYLFVVVFMLTATSCSDNAKEIDLLKALNKEKDIQLEIAKEKLIQKSAEIDSLKNEVEDLKKKTHLTLDDEYDFITEKKVCFYEHSIDAIDKAPLVGDLLFEQKFAQNPLRGLNDEYKKYSNAFLLAEGDKLKILKTRTMDKTVYYYIQVTSGNYKGKKGWISDAYIVNK